MADVVFACCNVAELLPDMGLEDQPDAIKPPDWETTLLIAALAPHGIEATWAVWDDPDIPWDAHRLCVVRSTWTYFRRPEVFRTWIRHVDRCADLLNPRSLIEWNMHKGYLLDLVARGVRVIPTEVVRRDDPRTVGEIAAQHSWSDIIVKPVISAGAMGIGRFRAYDAGAQDHLAHLLVTGDVLIQPFAPAIQREGELSLVFIDSVFSHAVRKHPLPGDFRAQPHLGITLAASDPSRDELAVATTALEALPVTALYARIDLVEYDGGPAVVECELIDPYLFLDRVPEGVEHLTQAIVQHLGRSSSND